MPTLATFSRLALAATLALAAIAHATYGVTPAMRAASFSPSVVTTDAVSGLVFT